MTPLLLVALAQLPSPPVAPVPPPAAEPTEVSRFADFVDAHLLAANATLTTLEVRQGERSFRMQDDDFETAFALVPETVALARSAREGFLLASALQTTGVVALGLALVPIVIAPLVAGAFLPLLVVGAVAAGVAAIISLIALPIAAAAQERFFAAVARHNHKLLELRPSPAPTLGAQLLTF